MILILRSRICASRWIKGFHLFLFACLFLFSVHCTKKTNQTDYDLPLAETLRINLSQEPPSLDWNRSTDTTSSLVTNNLMEGLVEYNLADPQLSLQPALAVKWQGDAQARVWTLTLRQGVKWTDGVPFTAQQVLDGWERLLLPATASEYAYFLFGIKNAQAFHQGKVKDFSQVGVKIGNQGETLIVELERPMSYFPYLLTHHSTFPIRKDLIEKYKDRWTEVNNLVTLGAYKLKVWDHDRALVMERNDTYYGPKAKTKFVLAYMINEMTTAINLFDAGKIDFQNALPSRELRNLRTRKEYREHSLLMMGYYGFNTKKAPFDKVKVRQAFSYAVDRKQMTSMLGGGQTPLAGWIPVGVQGYDADRGLKFNPERANQLLNEAGYQDRTQFPRVKLAFNTNEDHQRVAENFQAQIKKNLSIHVELANEEWKVYLANLKANTPDIYRMGWVADFPDPDNFMNLMTGFSENNHTGWSSPTYDKLITQAVSILDPGQRLKIYAQAQKILTEDEAPVIPLFSSVGQSLVAQRVRGLHENGLNRLLFKDVTLQ